MREPLARHDWRSIWNESRVRATPQLAADDLPVDARRCAAEAVEVAVCRLEGRRAGFLTSRHRAALLAVRPTKLLFVVWEEWPSGDVWLCGIWEARVARPVEEFIEHCEVAELCARELRLAILFEFWVLLRRRSPGLDHTDNAKLGPPARIVTTAPITAHAPPRASASRPSKDDVAIAA